MWRHAEEDIPENKPALNRVSCSRLYEIGRVLNVPVQAFFAEAGSSTDVPDIEEPAGRDTLNLVNDYGRLSPALRQCVAKTAKSLADSAGKKF